MLSQKLQKSLYLEVEGEIMKKLSVGLGKSIMELREIVLGVGVGVGVRESVEEVIKINCILPWCGVKREGYCSELKLNSGLYTQCPKRCEEKYCESCLKINEKNGGEAPYGTVDERLKCEILDYVDPKGRKTIPFANIMKKMNINKEEAEKEAAKLGWTIPECHFIELKGQRGRPKKDTSADDTVSESSTKKRGRPKKTKEIVSNNAGEELIASLLIAENVIETPTIINPIEIKEITVNEELSEEEIDEEDDDDETQVVKFQIDGKEYLKSQDNVLYDIESHDAIGCWNETMQKIDEIPEEEED
jgi:hypothetical protein